MNVICFSKIQNSRLEDFELSFQLFPLISSIQLLIHNPFDEVCLHHHKGNRGEHLQKFTDYNIFDCLDGKVVYKSLSAT